ncbi:hypothetical protein MPL3356_200007 [Mesorhizobium plurifarium]|uniref:Uncharacterized protein n=1 Tax=Mesorhizobium plurifarium TaxID=69974 RepID=A0A090DJ01_MESPL|nr:hypothetical protein MPL3356_200007 [Mesorhizobium plurifarium]
MREQSKALPPDRNHHAPRLVWLAIILSILSAVDRQQCKAKEVGHERQAEARIVGRRG